MFTVYSIGRRYDDDKLSNKFKIFQICLFLDILVCYCIESSRKYLYEILHLNIIKKQPKLFTETKAVKKFHF